MHNPRQVFVEILTATFITLYYRASSDHDAATKPQNVSTGRVHNVQNLDCLQR